MPYKYLLPLAAATVLLGCGEHTAVNESSSSEITAQDLEFSVRYLASDALEGRATGSAGARQAATYIANSLEHYGLEPAGDDGTWFHAFNAIAGVRQGDGNRLALQLDGEEETLQPNEHFTPVAHSENGTFAGSVIFAGYGIVSESKKYDDYAGLDVKDKIVMVLRYSPDGDDPHSDFFQLSSSRRKAAVARDKGAAGLILVSGPKQEPEDELIPLRWDRSASRSGIGVVQIRRDQADRMLSKTGSSIAALQTEIDSLRSGKGFAVDGVSVIYEVDVQNDERAARNVAGVLRGSSEERGDDLVIIGAHYDHLGMGGSGSLSAEVRGEVHNGADDNGSGTAGLLELAEALASRSATLQRSYLFIAFSGEELGLLGSKAYVENPPVSLEKAVGMLNMDMIGRVKDNRLILYGMGTAPEWDTIVDEANGALHHAFELKKNKDGTGPSDFSSFYSAKMPVLALFTGIHDDYHKPTDDADRINYDDHARVVQFAEGVLTRLDTLSQPLQFTEVGAPREQRVSAFRVYLGTIPDYAETDVKGLKLSGVRKGGPADRAGLESGDTIVKFGDRDIENIYDYTYALQDFKPGDVVEIVVERSGERLAFEMTLERKK